jgi:hypothetical protein
VQVDDIIYISEIGYDLSGTGYNPIYFDILYADKNKIRLKYNSEKYAKLDKQMLMKCLNYIDIMNEEVNN